MHHSGFAGRVPDLPEPIGSFWVNVSEQYLHGASVLETTFSFPDGDAVSFKCPRTQIEGLLPGLNADIESALKANLGNDEICGNLHDIGQRLTDCLLVSDPAPETKAERRRLATLLRQYAASDLQCRVNLPIPIELLVFDTPIAGMGPFARMIGGRPNNYYVSRSRPGRPAGKGVSFFHDDIAYSVSEGHALAAVQTAFGHRVDQHANLENGKLPEAQKEIDRLFKDGKSAWAHFQCHVEYLPGQPNRKRMRLTRQFFAGTERFPSASSAIAGIFMNGCGATSILVGQPPPNLQSSWSEYFMGTCYVPAVIGPFCAVPDDRTLPFTRAFYASLAAEGDAYASFVNAKRTRLAATDCTAITYRYVGQRVLRVPLDAPLGQLDFFDPEAESAIEAR